MYVEKRGQAPVVSDDSGKAELIRNQMWAEVQIIQVGRTPVKIQEHKSYNQGLPLQRENKQFNQTLKYCVHNLWSFTSGKFKINA